MSVARSTKLMRAPRFAEGKNAIDYWREFSRVDYLRDLGEFLAVRSSAQPDPSSAVFFCFVFGRLLNERDQSASFFQNVPRTFLRIAADGVEHNIDIAHDAVEFQNCVIDQFIRAELIQHLVIFQRGSADNVCAFPRRELHRKMTHSSGCTMDQDTLFGLKLRRIE